MPKKWKIYWVGFAVFIVLNVLSLFMLPFNRAKTTGEYQGVPEGYYLTAKRPLPESYYLYYVNDKAYFCQRGLYLSGEKGHQTTIVYNSKKPWQAYHYSFLNFFVLITIPFIFAHFVWFAFFFKVYDPLMEPVFPKVTRTINIDGYQQETKMRRRKSIPRQVKD